MGRKRLTKHCSQCQTFQERKDFLRSEWEKTDEAETVRLCRTCDLQQKRSREAAVLLSPPSAPLPASHEVDPVELMFTAKELDEDEEEEDFRCLEELFSFSNEADLSVFSLAPSAAAAAAQASNGGNKEQTRSLQAKRRRAKLNALFSNLAEEVGLSSQADRVTILEQSRELIRELRGALKKQKMTSEEEEDLPLCPAVLPVLSIADISVELDLNTITHSALA